MRNSDSDVWIANVEGSMKVKTTIFLLPFFNPVATKNIWELLMFQMI